MDSRFEKALKLYQSKYECDMPHLFKFIETKVELEDRGLDTLKECFLQHKSPEDAFSKEELKLYFHMIAAHQAKVNIKGKDPSTLTAFTNLKFLKSKPKGVKDPSKPEP